MQDSADGRAQRVSSAAALLLALSCGLSQAQTIITTLAGSRYIFPAGSIAATKAPVGNVSGVTEDRQGNIYFSDLTTDRVYRVDSNGILTTYAGSGTRGYGGDGGPAGAAALSNPRGLVFDNPGNLYICDAGNNRIRKVSATGIISTVAGNGSSGFSGDNGPATAASFGGTTRIALDNKSNIYISDPDNHRIRQVTTDGMIHTFAGNGMNASAGDRGPASQASLQSPAGLAFDPSGNLYVADLAANRVREIAVNGTISTLAGNGTGAEGGDGGPATQARLNGPAGVAVEGAALLIADQSGSRIRSVSLNNGLIGTVAGTSQVGMAGDGGPALNASLYSPVDLFVSSGSGPGSAQVVLIADLGNFRVRSMANGILSTIAGNGNYGYARDGGIASSANLPSPDGVAIDPGGNVNICDSFANRVRTINPSGIISLTAGTSAPGYAGDGGPATQALLVDCQGIARDGSGNLYVADTHNNRIRKIGTSGIIGTVAGNGLSNFSGDGGPAVNAALSGPQGVAVDAQGNIYIADTGNNRIRKVTTSGTIATIAGSASSGYAGDGGSATAALLNGPARAALDPAGNIYFTDNDNNVVRRVLAGGIIQTVAGNGEYGFSGDGGPAVSAMLANPIGLAIDASGGLLIADADNRRVRRVDPSGVITTIAGNGSNALSGDGRPPLSTGFGSPADVAVDAAGNIYVADQADGRVRRIQPAPSSLVLSDTGLTFTTAVDGTTGSTGNLRILNGGAGTIGWSAVTTVLSGPANWLSISPSEGTSTSSSTSSPVTLAVNSGGFAPGNYYGRVEIASPGVANSPRFVTVVLRVLTAAQTSGPSVAPAGFLFAAAAGGSNPAAQTLTISEVHGGALSFSSSIVFGGVSQWLTVTPAAGSLTPAKPASLILQPNLAGLSPGIYTATLNLGFAGGSTRSVPVTLTVHAASMSSVGIGAGRRDSGTFSAAVACESTQLLPAMTTIVQGFTLPEGWPTPIDVSVEDDCGHSLTSGTVTATFSNGDPPLALSSLQDGTWSASWAPRSAANVTITVTAQGPPPASIRGTVRMGGQIDANAEPPIVNPGGILNLASLSPGEPLTPGALISVSGSNLANGTGAATSLPLPTQLAGTQVIIGGKLMPLLYAGPSQINAVVPFSLPVDTTQQVIVQSGATLSLPEPSAVVPGAPGVFTMNGSGSGAAIVQVVSPDGAEYLLSTAQPAHPGSIIVIYCTGLGGVQSSLHAGDSAPLSPLAPVTDTVSLTIGGATAQVLFAGLVPTLSGLYQVNAVIPAGTTGDSVPLVLAVAGLAGPPATIAIH